MNLTYEVRNREFERFLFAHAVYFISSHRDPDGTFVWVYEEDDYFRHLLQEWLVVLDRKEFLKKKK